MRSILGARQRCAWAALLLSACVSAETSGTGSLPVLSLAQALETTRFMNDGAGCSVFVSPDGARYAIALVRGDVARDGVWLEIRIGERSDFASATPRVVAQLFTRGRGAGYAVRFGGDGLTAPGSNPPVWLDARTLALLWEDNRGVRQLLAIDVERGTQRWLTHEDSAVVQFIASSPAVMIYRVVVPPDLARAERRANEGFAVDDDDAPALLHGSVRGAWDWMRHEVAILDAAQGKSRRVVFEGGEPVSRFLSPVPSVISPDQRFAIVAHTVSGNAIAPQWVRYTQDHFREMWTALRSESTGYYSRQFQKLFVVDVSSARAQPLWDVPVDGWVRTQLAWSPEGEAVAIAPTFLPLVEEDAADDEQARAGDAAAVVNVTTGQWQRLPLLPGLADHILGLTWRQAGQITAQLRGGGQVMWSRTGAGWAATHIHRSEAGGGADRYLHVEVRQALNRPPTLWGQEGAGRSRVLFDPNPSLSQHRLGRVEWVDARNADGSRWEGRLYYPSDYTPGRRYPLVVQTYAFAGKSEFSLYGHAEPALGPGRSAYIAQALAGRQMFVLHGPSRADSVNEVEAALDALEAQVGELAARGLIDPNRIGIMGYSASGWLTSYALTRGAMAYAAALTDDSKDGSYFQAGLSGWEFAAGEAMIGTPPFGAGLTRWLQVSPAFNVERIHTPLLITRSSPASPLNGWELFSRLRQLRKPVEYYVIPDVEHGSHALQNPRQLLALQQRALDWWCYWLKDERDPDPARADQYRRWDQLRALQRMDR